MAVVRLASVVVDVVVVADSDGRGGVICVITVHRSVMRIEIINVEVCGC